jgi:hypothetical protein
MAKSAALDQKAKEKKQKIFVGVGGVLLLALLAFQVPKMMAMMSQKPPPLPPGAVVQPPNGFPAGAAQAPLAAPTLAGSNGETAQATAAGGIVDSSSLRAAPASGQLISFGRFASKDPFNQQVDPAKTASAVSSGSKGGDATPPAVPPDSPLGPSGSGSSPPSVPAGPLPRTASIAINGVTEIVEVEKDFPAADPVFHLVAYTRTSAKIAIAGGSYADGAPTVTLKKGKTLTLENTADGSLFTLRLIAFDPPATAVTTPAPAAAVPTPAAAVPTSTTTLAP